MVAKIMEGVSLAAWLLVASWRPLASYQLPVVCTGAVLVVLSWLYSSSNAKPSLAMASMTNPITRDKPLARLCAW
jgi:hypothetical protein